MKSFENWIERHPWTLLYIAIVATVNLAGHLFGWF